MTGKQWDLVRGGFVTIIALVLIVAFSFSSPSTDTREELFQNKIQSLKEKSLINPEYNKILKNDKKLEELKVSIDNMYRWELLTLKIFDWSPSINSWLKDSLK